MPIIRITSLPFEPATDIPAALRSISASLASLFDIEEEYISITWNYLAAGHYCCGGDTVNFQPPDHHPVSVHILVPDFNPVENIQNIIVSVAELVAKSVKVSPENVFIHLQTAQSGFVFDKGSIVEWPPN